jgi:hypothetical protein
MKEYYFAVIKFPVLVSTVLIILVGLFFLLALGSNSRTGISGNETIIYTLVFISLVFLVSNWILVLMSTHSVIKPPFVQRFSHWMLSHVYYPMAKALNFITLQKTHTLQESFLNFNNEIVMSNNMRLENPKKLVLLPHCCKAPSARSVLPMISTTVQIAEPAIYAQLKTLSPTSPSKWQWLPEALWLAS